MDDTRDDSALVAAVRGGDHDAFAELFARWSNRCFDVARRILHDDGRAAEVTQEVFTVAWQQLATLRDPAAFGGWVLRTSRNRALNRLEHERRAIPTDEAHPTLAEITSSRTVEGEAEASEHQELVWAAAAALGERDTSVLDLHLRHGLSVPEIAEELGVTTNNAHQMLHRTKQRLATSIRAWVVFRGGDSSCPALGVSLDAAGVSRFGPDAVKAIGRHLDDCEACNRRQAAVLAPEALFASAPIALLSPELRAAISAGLHDAGVPVAGGGGSAGGAHAANRGQGGGTSPDPSNGSSPLAGPGSSARLGARNRRGLAVAGAAVAVVVVAIIAILSMSGDGDRDREAASRSFPTTTEANGRGGGADPKPPVARVTTTLPASGDLPGTWTVDANDVLGANTANVGGTGGMTCTGPITMTFTDAGTFRRDGAVSCTSAGFTATGTLATSGSYEVAGDTLTITNTRNDGTIDFGGRAMPFPDAFGDAEATYVVDGATLQITFTAPGVGTVTQTYQRS